MKFNKYFSTLARWFIVTIIIVYFWIFLHELSHSAVCMLIGGHPYLASILPHPSINCEGIVNASGLTIKPVQYFIYAIIPYIMDFIVVLILFLKKIHIKWTYILASFILLETVWNYFGAFFVPTDFRQVLMVSKQLFIISAIIVAIISVISVNILTRRWKEFREYGKGVFK